MSIMRIVGWLAALAFTARVVGAVASRDKELARLRRRLKRDWTAVSKEVSKSWNWLTDDELDRIGGRWDRLVKKVRKRTGSSAEAVEAELRGIMATATT